jgi:hypothetical protein
MPVTTATVLELITLDATASVAMAILATPWGVVATWAAERFSALWMPLPVVLKNSWALTSVGKVRAVAIASDATVDAIPVREAR